MTIDFREMKRATAKHLLTNTPADILVSALEELGETAAAHKVEVGKKNKDLKEDSKVECIDTILCLLSFYVAKGGTEAEFKRQYKEKMDKWKKQIKKRNKHETSNNK